MRIDEVEGLYLKYKYSGRPVERYDHVAYPFIPPDRTCLVKNPHHITLLLETRRFDVVGVEVPDSASITVDTEGGTTTGSVSETVTLTERPVRTAAARRKAAKKTGRR